MIHRVGPFRKPNVPVPTRHPVLGGQLALGLCLFQNQAWGFFWALSLFSRSGPFGALGGPISKHGFLDMSPFSRCGLLFGTENHEFVKNPKRMCFKSCVFLGWNLLLPLGCCTSQNCMNLFKMAPFRFLHCVFYHLRHGLEYMDQGPVFGCCRSEHGPRHTRGSGDQFLGETVSCLCLWGLPWSAKDRRHKSASNVARHHLVTRAEPPHAPLRCR